MTKTTPITSDWYFPDGETGCPGQFSVYEPPEPQYSNRVNDEGQPVFVHAVIPRFGFHPPDRAYHAPTLELDDDDSAHIVGWVNEDTHEFTPGSEYEPPKAAPKAKAKATPTKRAPKAAPAPQEVSQ